MIDRALRGPDAARDIETRTLLDQWLQRPRRDSYVDVSSTLAVCGSEACQPVPVPLRPPSTFLWQDDLFQVKGGGSGVVESSGLDYILPYCKARYYGVIGGSNIQSAAEQTRSGRSVWLPRHAYGGRPVPLSEKPGLVTSCPRPRWRNTRCAARARWRGCFTRTGRSRSGER
jgi:hypothetical protein